jgi:monoamine oxidase
VPPAVTRTVVVGAGAAGIAAARTLHDAGADVLLLEASDRLGGRAQSVRLPGDHTIDLGCGWLHSAGRNSWTAVAERAGFAIDRSSPRWDEQWRDLGFAPAEQEAFGRASERWASAAGDVGDPDRSLADFLAPQDECWRPLLDAISGYVSGAPLERVSAQDWAAYEGVATQDNWALPDGYGTLVAGHAAGVPVRLSTPVNRIDHSGQRLRLDTPRGTIEADRAIVCVPTSVLADGALSFFPALPDKLAAASVLPLGQADKIFLRVEEPPWPAHSHLTGNPHSALTASYRLSPFGWPVIEAFIGGLGTEALAGEAAAFDFAIGELVALLGSEWRRRLSPLTATRWREIAWIGGSYSYATVGNAGARQVLAAPIDDRLFFAGEACSATDFSTAHGAHDTGVAAARAVLAAMAPAR